MLQLAHPGRRRGAWCARPGGRRSSLAEPAATASDRDDIAVDDLDARDILERLSAIDLLRALPPEEIQALVPRVRALEFDQGKRLMELGAPGDALYFVEAGRAAVLRPNEAAVTVEAGTVLGEAALLSGQPRSATVIAETPLVVWRVGKADFDALVARSPELKRALQELMEQRDRGAAPSAPSRGFWVATALRAVEARSRGLTLWQGLMYAGFLLWALRFASEHAGLLPLDPHGSLGALWNLVAGLLIIQGACEAFLHGVERLGARLSWDGFISGTVGSLLSTLPEFVVIAFLVRVDPLAAFVTAVVTIFNNALAFSIYSFFLPKDARGVFAMPRSLAIAGGQIVIAGGAVALVVGLVMAVMRIEGSGTALEGWDLIWIGTVLLAIYVYYLRALVRYYSEGKDDEESLPPDPDRLGHDTSWSGIGGMFALGILGSYAGGESIGDFAEIALGQLGLPTIPTAAALAFFAGISEYIIVFKSHRRGELGIALSNVFGGLSQVMFLLLPFGMVVIGLLGLGTGDPRYVIPVNAATLLLMLLLFPLFYVLHQYLGLERKLSDLDAAAMTGLYALLLYFLFTTPTR